MSFALSEAREAFIKQFSLLEASTGALLAQLHGITSTLNCSISMTEEEGKERRKDEGSRGVCQTFTETTLMVRASQTQLKQATLDLDNMVGKSNLSHLQHCINGPHSKDMFQVFYALNAEGSYSVSVNPGHKLILYVTGLIFLSLLWDAAVYCSLWSSSV